MEPQTVNIAVSFDVQPLIDALRAAADAIEVIAGGPRQTPPPLIFTVMEA